MASAVESPTQLDTERVLEMIRKSDRPDVPPIPPMESLPAIINRHMGEKDISTDVLCGLVGVDRSTLYRFLNGARRPSRDTLIALARALELDFHKTQYLLKAGRLAQLTPRHPRDFLIVFSITKGYCVGEVDDLLTQEGYEALSSGG